MKTIRTTFRIEEQLKIEADKKAFDLNITLQKLFNDALRMLLKDLSRQKASRVVLFSKPVDKRIDNLTRDEIYED